MHKQDRETDRQTERQRVERRLVSNFELTFEFTKSCNMAMCNIISYTPWLSLLLLLQQLLLLLLSLSAAVKIIAGHFTQNAQVFIYLRAAFMQSIFPVSLAPLPHSHLHLLLSFFSDTAIIKLQQRQQPNEVSGALENVGINIYL